MFQTKSVDALIAGSSKLISKLEAAAEAHHVDYAAHVNTVVEAQKKAEGALSEAARATTIATKLKGIFS